MSNKQSNNTCIQQAITLNYTGNVRVICFAIYESNSGEIKSIRVPSVSIKADGIPNTKSIIDALDNTAIDSDDIKNVLMYVDVGVFASYSKDNNTKNNLYHNKILHKNYIFDRYKLTKQKAEELYKSII